MEHETQHTRAIRFRELHDSPRIFVLPNAWDAASARIFEKAGFHAVGTTSAGVAASLGFPDGERVDRETMLAVVGRIASTVSLPVTADMESGFGETVEKVVETAQAVLHAGAVGMNLEDAAGRDRSTLADIGVQVEKIQAVRQAAKSSGIPIVINARTDVYLREVGEPVARLEHTVRRANAYRKAGADCLFVPGVRDPEIIRRLCAEVDGPVNILAGAGIPPVAKLERLGVRRVSVGSGPMRATLTLIARIARELLDQGTYSAFQDAVPYAEVNRMFEEQS